MCDNIDKRLKEIVSLLHKQNETLHHMGQTLGNTHASIIHHEDATRVRLTAIELEIRELTRKYGEVEK